MIPFPPFAPDTSPFNPLATGDLKNCIPVEDGWRPLPSLTVITDALPAACVGATYVRNSSGSFTLIAGTTAGLYSLDTGTMSWTDISGASAPYSVPAGDRWTFTRYGQYLIAHNINDAIQVYDIEAGGVFADLAGSPPKARYSCVAGEFLVLMHLEGESNVVHWSGIGDIEHWTIAEKGCDKQALPSGEEIMGGIGDERGALIIQRNAMRYMQFAPESGYTFTFAPANEKRGTIAPLSIVQIGAGDFCYLSEDGFFRGVAGSPIGSGRVDRWFFATLSRSSLSAVKGIADPYEKIVWWTFEDAAEDRYLIGYDWQLDRWCYADNTTEEMVAVVTPGSGWDALDATYASIDAGEVTFDSRSSQGGAPTFAGFTTSHELAYFSGTPQAVDAYTAQVQINPAGRYNVRGARIITDALAGELAVGKVDYHGNDMTWGTATSMSSRTGFIGVRADGRLHRFHWSVPAGTAWTVLTGLEVEGSASGK